MKCLSNLLFLLNAFTIRLAPFYAFFIRNAILVDKWLKVFDKSYVFLDKIKILSDKILMLKLIELVINLLGHQ